MAPACARGSPSTVAGGSGDLLNELIPHGSDGHGTMGYPDMNGWPAFDVLTAQQAYWEWLKRAHRERHEADGHARGEQLAALPARDSPRVVSDAPMTAR